jgi:hypothetical protein
VHGILFPAPSDPESARYIASPCNSRSRPKQRCAHSRAKICRLNGWYTALIIISFCCLSFALFGCGGSIVVNGAGSGDLIASPNTVVFGAVSIGQSASTTVSLLNGSSAPVQITQLNLIGQPFSVGSPSHLPVTIAAGGTYSLNVQFNPAATGTATGQLTIASNSSTAGTPVINLSGTGTTGTGSAALSALYCSSGTMTGSGTDACTVTLTAAAPDGGLSVSLSSSNAAVTLPSTVTVPANATSAGFTANVSSVTIAQAVTMTASTSSVFKSFTLQLNAAILALSINATSVAFGDVVVNTPATQSVTLTSTGTVPVTVDGATLTGAGFTVSGADFPATLSPNQEAKLNIEFDPAAVGAATGQLTIASNSSTNGTTVIGLSGTGTAAPVVTVAVTPAKASTNTGATQQFAASVTETSNTAVTWTASGTGCSRATCGTISSDGLYTAPAAVPSSALVTITATSGSDPTKSASAAVTIVPPQAAGYTLAWEDTFSTLNFCTTNVAGCNWWPGVWNPNPGIITDPSGTYVNLNWVNTQTSESTNISSASSNGTYYHAWSYGYFEASMAFNPVTGSWPAVWMLPVSAIGKPETTGGELDLFEWNSQVPTTFVGTVIVWQDGVAVASNGTDGGNQWPLPSGANLSNYNTYGVLWTPTAISWYFNNQLIETFSTTSAPYQNAFAGQERFLILGQQAGCNWTQRECAGQVSPLNMQVQWVHVYASPATPGQSQGRT